MQASALSHYHAFLDSAECMAVVRKQLIAAVEGLSALADSVPALGAALEAFSSDAAGVMAQHAAIKQLAGVCCMCAHVHGSSRVDVVLHGCIITCLPRLLPPGKPTRPLSGGLLSTTPTTYHQRT